MPNLPVLVVQHEEACPPGRLLRWAAEAGVSLDVRECHRGNALPASLRDHGGLIVLGGQRGVYDDVRHPWLVPAKSLVVQSVLHEVPFLGVSLGHQLAGLALGGRGAGGLGRARTRPVGTDPDHSVRPARLGISRAPGSRRGDDRAVVPHRAGHPRRDRSAHSGCHRRRSPGPARHTVGRGRGPILRIGHGARGPRALNILRSPPHRVVEHRHPLSRDRRRRRARRGRAPPGPYAYDRYPTYKMLELQDARTTECLPDRPGIAPAPAPAIPRARVPRRPTPRTVPARPSPAGIPRRAH